MRLCVSFFNTLVILAQSGCLLRERGIRLLPAVKMPRYYCDYCDTHLTHDSPSVRKQHCAGYKHKANVRQYYQQFEEQQTQSLIDQKVKEHLGQTAAAFAQQQIGGAFHQHLATLQSGQYKPLPAPGLLQQPSMPPSMRPPVLQPPSAPTSGYGPISGGARTYRPPVTQAPASNGPTPQYYANGNAPAQPQQQQYSSSNGAPQQQYANSNSTLPPQQHYSTSSSTLQPQYTTSNTTSQHHYSNGSSRPPMSSGFNGPPVYQQR